MIGVVFKEWIRMKAVKSDNAAVEMDVQYRRVGGLHKEEIDRIVVNIHNQVIREDFLLL